MPNCEQQVERPFHDRIINRSEYSDSQAVSIVFNYLHALQQQRERWVMRGICDAVTPEGKAGLDSNHEIILHGDFYVLQKKTPKEEEKKTNDIIIKQRSKFDDITSSPKSLAEYIFDTLAGECENCPARLTTCLRTMQRQQCITDIAKFLEREVEAKNG